MSKGENEAIRQLVNSRIVAAQKQAELLQRIADLERHNELLREIAAVANRYDVNGKPFFDAYQAAIDGGALEED
jgi:hypothetical protein